ncbi:hypothetical protein N4T77_18955 [Clostridium sp. CX1]|uniref:hypothetical protein n=1 Tax=Clostridium sp. CX1 TaxID=2978346 RepID=UPI0021BE8E8C|nr:hypothetical protein [Clostridium sp. CX1]MCT8978673.1 hypothetical protein [Clostridium sp. CX1]
MGRGRVKQLSKLVLEANDIIDEMHQENKELRSRVVELEESCESFVKVGENLHRKIAEMEKNKVGMRQRLMNFFS